ncbi:MAG: transcriptional repressor [Akkermansia sp.]|nr:transcriptional repressor [Akkermansia sp.]
MSIAKTSTPRAMAAELVRTAGVRMTRQRRAVLEAVLGSCDHPTAASIFERARQILPGISLATVYNCLETLAETGLINHLNFDNGPSRFCANLEPHVHLIDDASGTVLDIHLKTGLRPEDVFDLPPGTCITSMDTCLRGRVPQKSLVIERK